ncbi:MAG: hypothetical protein AABY22_00845 [Nanoarchaeota archaeon]
MEQQIITKINESDIKKFYEFLNHKNETELRFIQPGLPQIQLWVNNYENFLKKIKEYNGKYNIYVGLNEREKNGDTDADIKIISHFPHDIDAHDGNIETMQTAQEIALQIKDETISVECKEPLMICSGRGFWVFHKINIVNNEENKKKIKLFGEKIQKKYERGNVKIDTTVHNPSRIVRVPGTINMNHPDKTLSFIINQPSNEIDKKLSEEILSTEIPTYVHTIIKNQNLTPSINSFMDYCLTHEIPKGERHKTISRHIAHYISDHPDRELLKEQYIKIQRGSEGELDQWLKTIDKHGKNKYPIIIGELVSFTKKWAIPFNWKIIPEYQQWIKEKATERKMSKVIENEIKEEELQKDGAFLFQSLGIFTDFLNAAKMFVKKQPVFYDKNKMWWMWNHIEKKWTTLDEIDLLNIIDDKTLITSTSSCLLISLIIFVSSSFRLLLFRLSNSVYISSTDKTFLLGSVFFMINQL